MFDSRLLLGGECKHFRLLIKKLNNINVILVDRWLCRFVKKPINAL